MYERAKKEYYLSIQDTEAFNKAVYKSLAESILYGSSITDCKKLADDIAVELNL